MMSIANLLNPVPIIPNSAPDRGTFVRYSLSSCDGLLNYELF
jgi:hypothetical protein